MAAPKFAQLAKTYLLTPISSTENGSIVLNIVEDIYGNLPTISDFGGRLRCTFSPGNADEEIIYCTGFTRNADGSVVLDQGIIRAQDASEAGAGIPQPHSAGTIVVLLPDNPQLYQEIIDYINTIALASAVPASLTQVGYVKTTQTLSNPRVPVALVSQQVVPNMTMHVNPFSMASLDQIISFVGGNTATMTAPVSNPRIDLIVFSTTSGTVIVRAGAESSTPSTASPLAGDISLASIYHRVGETVLKEESDSTNGYVYAWYQPAIFNPNTVPAGTVIESAARYTPVGYLPADGSAVSRPQYPNLFAAICPSQTFTVTIASPAVVTANAHGLSAGDKIHFTTTGGLPSGMAANTDYYVIASGLTTNAFEFALSPSGSAVNTTGTQSGIQTLYKSAYGKGDGSTTFNVPDRRSRVALGIGSSAPNTTLSFEPSAVDATNNWVTIINSSFPAQGQAITLTSTGTLPGGLVTATTYYVVRLTTTTFGFATTLALANALTLIDLSSTGTGVITAIFANALYANLGIVGGEETHGLAGAELGDHDHTIQLYTTGGGGAANGAQSPAGSTGAGTHPGLGSPSMVSPKNGVHNNLQPFIGQNFYIKY